ncbi:hypothetical protein I8751_22640 [Nostocaceae cyanobacterium CENA357]|uniref:Uncharacterized protein n=1 Tax=Atlanticothrix silvestris CENA357 TaxID=1725252 RepID=A0A8J7L3M6_9CYAN|nr:hypothetical protein [Atlanticothrix silvestris]MBH8555095.1 hypothetical protein [Atlanticothrix silvestris CENA357]
MDLHQQRKQDLKEHIDEEYMLLKELEDDLRLTQEVQPKTKLKKQIKEVKGRIKEYRNDLDSLSNSQQEQNLLVNAMANITFRELDMVTNGILSMPVEFDESYTVVPVVIKMSKNELTGSAQSRLTSGVIQARMVGKFVENMVNVIPDFPEKLKAGFAREYHNLRATGLKGNALLDALHEFSCNRSLDYDLRAAGLAVLYYLFEKCEVFER